MKSTFISLLSLCLVMSFFAPLGALANYTVVPLVIDKELEKRDIITETVTLTNTSDGVVRIYPTVNEISVDEGGTLQTFVTPSMEEDRTTSITSWIEITRGRIELAPGESRDVPLTIKVHPDVTPGEYHAFIGFPRASNRPEAEKMSQQGGVPGTMVRIGVDKVQNQFLRLERFSVERFIKDEQEGDIQYSLLNPGDDPVIPAGEVIFYDNNGYEVASTPINPEGKTVPEGETVDFVGEVPDNLKLGKYKAFLSVEYGDHQTASLHDTAFFYVMPLKWVIIIFAVVLIFAILLALYVHKKYDMADPEPNVEDVPMYIRQGRSESKEHDIDLSQKNKE